MDSAAQCIASHPFSITFDEATGQATVNPRDGATVLVKGVTSGKLVFCITLPTPNGWVGTATQGLPEPTQTEAASISTEAQSQEHPIITVQSSTLQPVPAPLPAVPSISTRGAEPLQLLADDSNAANSHSSAVKAQTQISGPRESPAWASREERSAAASPTGSSATTSPSVPSVISYVNPAVTPTAPLMLQPAAMHYKATLTVKTSTSSPRGPEAYPLDHSSRHISNGSMTPTAQGSNGVDDHRVSLSKKQVADAQEAALRAIRGLHTETRLKDSTASPRRELLRLPPGIPIDSRASESKRASDLGNCSDSGGSQQDQSSPLSHPTTGCDSPGPVISDGAANDSRVHHLGRPPGLHAGEGGNNALASVQETSVEGSVVPSTGHAAIGMSMVSLMNSGDTPTLAAAFQEESSLELFSGQEGSRGHSTLQSLSQQGIHSHVSTFQRPVPQSLVGGLHHVNGDLSRIVPPPPPPPLKSAPQYVQQAQHGHHLQHAQLTQRALQCKQQSGSLPTYRQLSALDYQPGQGGYLRTVSQGATDMHYRGLQTQGAYQSPVSTRDIVRLMAQEVARNFIQSEVPVRQQWQPPPPPPQAQLSALPQQGTATARAPRSDSFEFGFDLSTEIASMRRISIEKESELRGDPPPAAGQCFPVQNLQGLGTGRGSARWNNNEAAHDEVGFQANGGSVMGSEGRSRVQGYEGGWSTAEALAGGAQLGLLPVRQNRSMGINRAGLPQMPNGASSAAVSTTVHGFDVLSGADERVLPIPHVDWLAGVAGDQQPSFPADSLTNSDLQSSPETAGSAGMQQTLTATWMPHLTGTHASSDELPSFTLPAMFDFLDEVGNLPY